MADSKITALTSISTSTDPANDPLVIVDVSDTSMAATGTTKKVTLNNLLSSSPTATGNFTITGDLTVDTSTLKVDSANNRVGIGTASPSTALDVFGGNIRLVGGNIFQILNTANDSNVDISNNGGSGVASMLFKIAGTSAMTLNSTGLGVGVASPQYKIHASQLVCASDPTTNGSAGRIYAAFLNAVGEPGLDLRRWDGGAGNNHGTTFIQTNLSGDTLFYNGVQASNTRATSLKATLLANGKLLVGPSSEVGPGGILQLSSGITFPATQVASTDANTLDDYVEGTWTPTLNSGTFSSASCRYTKIGNMVTVFFDLTVGTGGGSQITNLPFTAAATSTVSSGIYTNNQTYAAGTTSPVAVIGGSSTTLFFRTVGSGVAFSAMSLTAGANLTGSISYFV